jgi:hypothetical protein
MEWMEKKKKKKRGNRSQEGKQRKKKEDLGKQIAFDPIWGKEKKKKK